MLVQRIKAIVLLLTVTLSVVLCPISAAAAEIEFNDMSVAAIKTATNIDALKAKSAILVEAVTGTVLFEKDAHMRLPIASITKIMSMLLVMEAVDSGRISMDTIVTASSFAQSMGGSGVYLERGEKHTVKELLKAVAVASANDATVALAEHIAGSEKLFVEQMNAEAARIGMKNSHFSDCTGLDEKDNYSTAYDITIMARELSERHPSIHELTTIWHDKFRNGTFDLDNTNKLIRYFTDKSRGIVCNGLKTGFTNEAGYCLCATSENETMKVVSVVLGEPDTNTRFAESSALMEYGLTHFETGMYGNAEEALKSVPLKKGISLTVDAACKEQTAVVYKKGSAQKVKSEMIFDEGLTAPVKKGQKIGEIVYSLDEKEVARAELVSLNDVKKASFITLFFRMVLNWLGLRKD